MMIDLSNAAELERYLRASEAYKEYNLAAKKTNYKRHIVFDDNGKTLCIVPNEQGWERETYRLGKVLLDFVNMDLTEYERERVETLSLIQDPETDYMQVGFFHDHGVMADETFDLRFNQLVCIDRLIRRFQDKSPYIAVFDADYVTLQGHDPITLLNTELNFIALQKELERILELCLNEQIKAPYAKLSPVQRYAIHTNADERMPIFSRNSAMYVRMEGDSQEHIARLKTTKRDLDRLEKAHGFDDIEYRPAPDSRMIIRVLRSNIVMEEGYAVQTARDMAMLELSQMIQQNVRVRRCARCHDWFSPCGKHDTLYCANVAKGEKYSCQKIAGRKHFAEKTRRESPYKAYRAAYKVQNQRMQRGMITEQAFKEWQGNAQRQLELCKAGEIALEQFKKWMDENSTRHVLK